MVFAWTTPILTDHVSCCAVLLEAAEVAAVVAKEEYNEILRQCREPHTIVGDFNMEDVSTNEIAVVRCLVAWNCLSILLFHVQLQDAKHMGKAEKEAADK